MWNTCNNGMACSCNSLPPTRSQHANRNIVLPTFMRLWWETLAADITYAKDAIKESYELNRRPAKKLLLTVISHLDRMQNRSPPDMPQAISIVYHMGVLVWKCFRLGYCHMQIGKANIRGSLAHWKKSQQISWLFYHNVVGSVTIWDNLER